MVGPYRTAFRADWFGRPYGADAALALHPRVALRSTLGYSRLLPPGGMARQRNQGIADRARFDRPSGTDGLSDCDSQGSVRFADFTLGYFRSSLRDELIVTTTSQSFVRMCGLDPELFSFLPLGEVARETSKPKPYGIADDGGPSRYLPLTRISFLPKGGSENSPRWSSRQRTEPWEGAPTAPRALGRAARDTSPGIWSNS